MASLVVGKAEHPAFIATGERWACTTVDPDLFFVSEGSRGLAKWNQEQAAKRVCVGCPILAECRAWATRTRQAGIWGGSTEEEREGG